METKGRWSQRSERGGGRCFWGRELPIEKRSHAARRSRVERTAKSGRVLHLGKERGGERQKNGAGSEVVSNRGGGQPGGEGGVEGLVSHTFPLGDRTKRIDQRRNRAQERKLIRTVPGAMGKEK